MARPRKFDEQVALNQAMNLFWTRGYENTSLDDLLQAMNLSKSSFYQTFQNKHALLQQSILRYRESTARRMQQELDSAPSGIDFIRSTLEGVAEKAHLPEGQRGCLVMNCAGEFAQSDPAVAALVKQSIARFKSVFLQAIQRAQQEGDIAPGRNPDTLASYLVGCKSGLETMAKAGCPQDEMLATIGFVMQTLSG